MRNPWNKLLAGGLAAGLLTCALPGALAADGEKPAEAGVYHLDVKKGTVTPLAVDEGGAPTELQASEDYADVQLPGFYAGAEAFKVSYTSADTPDSAYHLLFVLKADPEDRTTAPESVILPTEDNIWYIDQSEAVDRSSTVSFAKAYPMKMGTGHYQLCAAQSGGGLELLASFDYYQPYMLGDVNEDGYVNNADVTEMLKHNGDLITLTGPAFDAANVVADDVVNSRDITKVLQYLEDRIPTLE